MKKSLKVLGFLLALSVPAGCLAVKKNLLMVLIGCCCGDSRPETGGPSTVYEATKNPSKESEVDPLEKETEELLKGQEEVYVNIGDLLNK